MSGPIPAQESPHASASFGGGTGNRL